jgi:hypothetical protein
MEKSELVEDLVSIEGFKEYFDMFDDDQIEEAFSKPMYLNVNLLKISSVS